MTVLQNDTCWQAVCSRVPLATGYSSSLFGPPESSAARVARPDDPIRQNVEFFSLPREAEAAGYRACLRCKPTSLSQAQEQTVMIEAACRLIEDRIAQGQRPPKLDELANQAGISKFHLQRQFKAQIGISPHGFAKAKMDEAMRKQLAAGQDVTTASYDSGHSGPGQFYARAHDILGMTSAAYRDGGTDQLMWHSLSDSSLGRVAVAGTKKGISAVRFGECDRALKDELIRCFQMRPGLMPQGAMDRIVSQVIKQIELPEALFELPLDLQGTVFQQKSGRACVKLNLARPRAMPNWHPTSTNPRPLAPLPTPAVPIRSP